MHGLNRRKVMKRVVLIQCLFQLVSKSVKSQNRGKKQIVKVEIRVHVEKEGPTKVAICKPGVRVYISADI